MNAPWNRPILSRWARAAAASLLAMAMALPANAIPAFARKYGTSCLACHVVFPKLTPFGEAFRRNGYPANKKMPNCVWPGTIPGSVPISIGANGQAVIVRSKSSSAGQQAGTGAPPFSGITLQDMAEGHIWAGASLDDTITLWGELTFSTDRTVEVEHAQVLFNDVIGPKHLFNVVAGRCYYRDEHNHGTDVFGKVASTLPSASCRTSSCRGWRRPSASRMPRSTRRAAAA